MPKRKINTKKSSQSSFITIFEKVFASQRYVFALFALLFGLVGVYAYFSASAAPKNQTTTAPVVNLSLSPSSARVAVGQTISVGVWVTVPNASQYTNAVQANVSYPVDLFDFVSVDATNSPFTVEAQSVGGNGSVMIGRGSYTQLTGSQYLATINLKAKAPARSANISFTSGSQVIDAVSFQNILASTSGAKFSIR